MPDIFKLFSAPEYATFWEFQRYFINRAMDGAAREVLLVVGCLVALLLGILLFLRFRPKKPFIPQDWIVEPAQINDTLNIALKQRARFDLNFVTTGENHRPGLYCSLEGIGSDYLLLETSGFSTLPPSLEGRAMDCFFMLRKQESCSFFAFTTFIKNITSDEGICKIRVAFPERIESRQKRRYLRITPPEEYLLGAAIWRGADMPEGAARGDLSLWKKPSRLFMPGMREDFNIRDISSGGMRLNLPRNILAEDMDFFHVGSKFITILDLWEPDKAIRLRVWMLCRMQTPMLDFENKGIDISSQFLAWGKPSENGGSNLIWFKLASFGEVEPLGNWIMRRHLEFFRESEQAFGFAQ